MASSHLSLFCPSNLEHDFTNPNSTKNWSNLQPSARSFMESLMLPTVHPHCLNDDKFESKILQTDILSTSEGLVFENEGTLCKFITAWFQVAPALLAMSELWLRLFACIISPLAISFIILSKEHSSKMNVAHCPPQDDSSRKKRAVVHSFVAIIGMAASAVLLTDSLYVYAYGRTCGAIVFTIMSVLSVWKSWSFIFYSRRTLTALMSIIGITLYLLSHGEVGSNVYDDPGIDIPTIKEGLYYSKTNVLMSRVANLWPEQNRTYNVRHGATPYLPTGDSLTGIPFLVNGSPEQNYHRVWVENPTDLEAVALDISFPPDGIHSVVKPIYLVLHGLNGGSHEDYVREFVSRRTQEGSTCVVMIARGLMDTPVRGWNLFHGARVTDVDAAAKAIRKAVGPNQLLAGVGYSMGAIIISNYVARSGKDCHIDTAMAVSGGLDMREMLNFKRSMRLWQPMLAQTLRDDFIVTKFDQRFRHRLNREQYLFLMRASSVSAIDLHAIVTYNGFDDLLHYYSEMSAMGDSTAFRRKPESDAFNAKDPKTIGRIGNVSIPFCVLHALDDPLTTWRTMGHSPEDLVKSGSGNIMMLLTKSGGHVGWPLGLNPRSHGWKWMNDAVRDFTESVDAARKELSRN